MSELSQIRPYSITFSVANIKPTTDWYVQKLGFRKIQEKSYPNFKTSIVFLEQNGFRIELIYDENAQQDVVVRPTPPAHTSVLGPSQCCFLTERLDALKRELEEKEVAIEWEFENKELGVTFLFVRDPEGNLIQFLQPLST